MGGALAGGLVVQSLLEIQQLTHEGEVGRDVGLALFDEVVGLVETHGLLGHEVGHGDGNGATDPRQAVHQHALLVAPCLVCNTQRKAHRQARGRGGHATRRFAGRAGRKHTPYPPGE